MKHIVQVLTDTNVGGAGKYLLNYLKYFDRNDFRVTVILPEGSRLAPYIHLFDDVTLFEAPHMADMSYNKQCVGYLKRLFLKIKPDVLHTHACLSARIAGKQAKVPVVLATRHCIEPLPHGLKALAISTLNNALCDYYIAVSRAVITNLLESGIKRNKIKLVNNGVQPIASLPPDEIAALRAKYGVQPDETLFGIFGRLEEVKGHKYFIKAARQVIKDGHKAKFMIVGGGNLDASLRDLVAHYHLQDSVIFTGFVPEVASLLNITDINVNASESEAMSLSVLEAMSLSKPSIATEAGGNAELIKNEESGLLVGYADSASLASAMIRLMNNPHLASRLAQNAYEKYCRLYTVETMVANLEKIYREVLENVD